MNSSIRQRHRSLHQRLHAEIVRGSENLFVGGRGELSAERIENPPLRPG